MALRVMALEICPDSWDRLRHPRTLTPVLSRREREKSVTSQTSMDRLLAGGSKLLPRLGQALQGFGWQSTLGLRGEGMLQVFHA